MRKFQFLLRLTMRSMGSCKKDDSLPEEKSIAKESNTEDLKLTESPIQENLFLDEQNENGGPSQKRISTYNISFDNFITYLTSGLITYALTYQT